MKDVTSFLLLFSLFILSRSFLFRSFQRHGNIDLDLCMSIDPPQGTIEAIRSAARMGDTEKLKELTSNWKGHSILNNKIGDFMGLSPLHWAVAAGKVQGRKECVQILLDAGADIEAMNNAGNTALHYAAATSKSECVRILIENGANVEAKSLNSGFTALHYATQRGDVDCTLLLLDKEANLDAKDNNGDTPLHLATRFGKVDCEKLLLSRGATRTVKNNVGQTPYDYEAATITNLSYE